MSCDSPNLYPRSSYSNRHKDTLYAAQAILGTILEILPTIGSAVDFGCGVGTWLSVLKNLGVDEVLGLDGSWVDSELLEIPRDCFRECQLDRPVSLGRCFDLAISLEVGEHLPGTSAELFVDSLVGASESVLFSAAIPFQGGNGHLNEQWPDYWIALFRSRGYVGLDLIRRAIWDDLRIPVWYRQNTLLFVSQRQKKDLMVRTEYEADPVSLVHPEIYLMKTRDIMRLKAEISDLRSKLKSA